MEPESRKPNLGTIEYGDVDGNVVKKAGSL